MNKNKGVVKWYDNAKVITTLIICTILMMLICSQSFAVVGENSLRLFSSVINHNTTYLLVLIYFIMLKTYYGKKYFNYLNVFLMTIYLILGVTSFLTIIQSFSMNTVLMFLVNIVLLIYLFHTMFRDTRVWKEFNLGNSPFNEIKNDTYFGIIIGLITITLVVNLISTVVVSGLVVSILDAIYIALFARYIYLYREYLDDKKKDINNKGNFDALRKEISQDIDTIKDKVSETAQDIKEKTDEFIEKNEINEKIDNIKDKVSETAKDIKEKTDEFIEKNEINEKIDNIKDKVSETAKDIKEKTDEFIEKNEINEKVDNIKDKVNETAKDIKEKTGDLINKNKVDKKTNVKKSKSKTTKSSKKTGTKKKGDK